MNSSDGVYNLQEQFTVSNGIAITRKSIDLSLGVISEKLCCRPFQFFPFHNHKHHIATVYVQYYEFFSSFSFFFFFHCSFLPFFMEEGETSSLNIFQVLLLAGTETPYMFPTRLHVHQRMNANGTSTK